MDILFTAVNAALFIGCLLALTRCKTDAKHVERRRKAFDDAMARLHALRAELSALGEAHEALATQLAKLRGKFYSTLKEPAPAPAASGQADAFEEIDPELAATLALQRASSSPGT